MVAVYSFWSKPYKKFGGGYRSDRHLFSSLAFSALKAKPHFDSVVMYCSPDMVDYMARLEIFDEIIPCFDEIKDVPEKHWALSKMLVYSKQTKPFLHIDNDVYMMKRPPAQAYTSQFFAQSVETHEDFGHNYDMQLDAVDRQHKYPKYWYKDWIGKHEFFEVPFSHNAGVLGGTNIKAIKEYAETGIEYMLEMGDRLPDINTSIEQAYFAMYATANKIPVGSYIKSWNNIEDARNMGYHHFWGGTKRGVNPRTQKPYMDGVIIKLREIRPEIMPVINKLNIKFYGTATG